MLIFKYIYIYIQSFCFLVIVKRYSFKQLSTLWIYFLLKKIKNWNNLSISIKKYLPYIFKN